MPTHAAVIKRVTTGGTRAAAELKQQLKYLARKNRPDRAPVRLIESARYFGVAQHELLQNAPDQVQDTNRIIREFTQRVYQNVPAGAQLNHNLTMHFVMSFPPAEEMENANADYLERVERAGLDWAEEVFDQGYQQADGTRYSYDYVGAFHREGPDERHPHLHVVVNRRPTGHADAPLLRIERDHPHFSYDAMRQTAVRVSAGRDIELTFLPDLGEAEDLDLDILRMGLDYDAVGVAPADVHDEDNPDIPGDERTAEDLARGCTPPGLMLDSPAPSDAGDGGDGDDDRPSAPSSRGHTPGDFNPDFRRDSSDDDDDGGEDNDSLYRLTPPLRGTPAPAPSSEASDPAGGAQDAGEPSSSRKRPHSGADETRHAKRARHGERDLFSGSDDDDETARARDLSEPIADPSRANVSGEQEDRRAGKRKRVGDMQDTPDKRLRTEERPALAARDGGTESGETTGLSGGQEGAAGPSQPRAAAAGAASGARAGPSGTPTATQDPLVARRAAADSRRETAVAALQAHNRSVKQRAEAVSAQEAAALRAETLRLRRESVEALHEQRRAYRGQTNVTTRAQRELRAAEDRRLDNRNSTDGSRDPGSRSR